MDNHDHKEQEKLDAAMPWVGLYIIVASVVCTLSMAADVLYGIRHKLLWFPCRYFSLNAASLAFLGVALKLPMDLNTNMQFSADWLARIIGLFFMITAMSNFMPSLGSKSDTAVLTNVVALGILVITILVNIWIQTIQLVHFTARQDVNAVIAATFFMLLLLATIISSAITTPTTKRILKSKYQDMHKAADPRMVGFKIDKPTVDEMKKNWIAVETGDPQFVAARSIFSVTSGVICLLSAITLVVIYFKWFQMEPHVTLGEAESVYGVSTKGILVVQSIGVLVGLIAPISRWFLTVRFKCSEACHEINLRKEFKIEAHWTQILVEWRDSFSILQKQHFLQCNKYLYDAKWFLLTFCIAFQVSIVQLSKILLLGSIFLVRPFFLFFDKVRPNEPLGLESGETMTLTHHVLLLEGEPKLPATALMNIYHQADKLIQKGKSEKPESLILLLTQFRNFNGLRELDSKEVPRQMHSQEPSNCWTLPMVTLTIIAVALPNVLNLKKTLLVNSLKEGIFLTKLVDKILDANDRFLNVRRAADMGCQVSLYMKWQGFDLRKAPFKYKNSKEVLQELYKIAERTVVEFSREAKDGLMVNTRNLPINIIASYSMYRISRTILLSHQDVEDEQTDEELFEQLTARTVGIFAACLANFGSVITTMCHGNAIGEREKNVQKALVLLGQTEEILELLQQYKWPSFDFGNAACIEEYLCALIQPDNNDIDKAKSPVGSGEQITIATH